MRVWLTGRRGLLGSAFVEFFLKNSVDFVASDIDISSSVAVEEFLKRGPFTHVINCAAYTDVDGAEKEPEKAYRANVLGVKNLRDSGIKVVHFSSDYVFDGRSKRPYKEDDKVFPLNIYGQTKLESERLLLGSNALIIRLSWLFGKRGNGFIISILDRMRKEGSISVVNDQISRPTFTDDLVKATMALLPYEGIFHFANREEVSRKELASIILDRVKDRVVCKGIVGVGSEAFKRPALRPLYSSLDTTKYEKMGFEEIPSWKEILCEFLKTC